MKQRFLEMCQIMSPTGFEDNMQKYIAKTYKNEFNEFQVTEKGVLTAIYNKESDFSIQLEAHADEISLIVNGYNSDGSLCVDKNGGVRLYLYVGSKVRVLTVENKVYYGVVGLKGSISKDITSDNLYVDLGFNSIEEAKIIPLGSYVLIDSDYRELANNRIAARAIDDKIGDYIIHEAACLAIKKGCKNKLFVTTTTGEENTGRGAYQATSLYKPNIVVAVDVTYATDYLANTEPGDVKLGKGGVICNGSIVNRKLNQILKDCANKLNLSYQEEVFAGRTGTDGDTALKTNDGPAVVLFSIPLRNMHSSGEIVDFTDVLNMIEVLSSFLCEVNKNTNLLPFEI